MERLIANASASHYPNQSACPITDDTEGYTTSVRFALMFCFGTTLAIVGVAQNSILYYLFTTRAKFRESAIFFLSYVALFDALLDAGYILCLTVDVGANYWQLLTVHYAWIHYIRFALPLTKICKLTSTFCLIAASIERFHAANQWTFAGFKSHARMIMLFTCILAGCIIRGPIFFGISISHYPECSGTDKYRSQMTLVSSVSWLLHVVETFVGIVLPFAALIYLNVGIVIRLHRQRVRELRNLMLKLAVSKAQIDEHDDRIRHATRTLACLVLAYALSNALDVVLATWELIDRDSITEMNQFHRITADLVSVCTVLGNVVRLHIYACCDPDIHRALRQLLCQKPLQDQDMVSTTSVDNIEQALHQDHAISSLRRLSRMLDEDDDSMTREQREQLRDGLLRTMSALHLNQNERIWSPISLEATNYLSLNNTSSDQQLSPRIMVHLSDIFVPDIDLVAVENQSFVPSPASETLPPLPPVSHRSRRSVSFKGNGHVPNCEHRPMIMLTTPRGREIDEDEL